MGIIDNWFQPRLPGTGARLRQTSYTASILGTNTEKAQSVALNYPNPSPNDVISAVVTSGSPTEIGVYAENIAGVPYLVFFDPRGNNIGANTYTARYVVTRTTPEPIVVT